MLALLQQLSAHDALVVGLLLGVWWGGRNRRDTGQRIGVVEDAVAEVRGILKALTTNDEQRK